MQIRVAPFVKERNEALFSLDRERIEAYFRKQGSDMSEDDIVFWACVYKCICYITDVPENLVRKAKGWLHAHGMSEDIYPLYN